MQAIPQVSVVLTVYKRTEFLAEAIDSVLSQSYGDFEIIVADDSGREAAKQIVAGYLNSGKVRYLPDPETLGVALSLRQAVKISRGEFTAILNDDDLWEKDLLEKLVTPLVTDPQAVLASSDHWLMQSDGKINKELTDSFSAQFGRLKMSEGIVPNAALFAVTGGPAINLASVFRKEAIDWNLVVPQVSGAYDYWIGCLLAATGRPIYYVPKRLGRWRIHEGMETERRSHDKGENLVYILSTILERDWFPTCRQELQNRLAEALYAMGRDKLHYGRMQEARDCFWRSFRTVRNHRAFVRVLATFLPRSVQKSLKKFRGRQAF